VGRLAFSASALLSVEVTFDPLCTRISVAGHEGVDAAEALTSAVNAALATRPELVVVDVSRLPKPPGATLATLMRLRGLADRTDTRFEVVGLATGSEPQPDDHRRWEGRTGPVVLTESPAAAGLAP
jgi:hypothetical protein